MRIVCYGDSNTYGYDPRGFFGGRYDAEDRWVDLLEKQTGHEVINAGSNGREIPHGHDAYGLDSGEMTADILLVMLGTNDLLQGATAKEAAARMETFLISRIPHYRNILLVCPPPVKRGAWVSTDGLVAESLCLVEEYKVLAQRLCLSYVDTSGWNVDLAFDGVHFTEAGHAVFAERIAEYL